MVAGLLPCYTVAPCKCHLQGNSVPIRRGQDNRRHVGMAGARHLVPGFFVVRCDMTKKRAVTWEEMIEEVTLDFVVANDREPRDGRELAEWCRRIVSRRLTIFGEVE